MHGNKEISLCPVCYSGTLMQRNEHIRPSRIYHPNFRQILFDIPPESQSNLEIDIFLLRKDPDSTRIVPAMSGIYNKRKLPLGTRRSQKEDRTQYKEEEYLLDHTKLMRDKDTNFQLKTEVLLLGFIIY